MSSPFASPKTVQSSEISGVAAVGSKTDPKATRDVPDHALHLVTADLCVGLDDG